MDAIVRNGVMTTKAFHDAASHRDDRDILSSCNIFLMDNNKEQATLQSRPVELYMRAETGVFEQRAMRRLTERIPTTTSSEFEILSASRP